MNPPSQGLTEVALHNGPGHPLSFYNYHNTQFKSSFTQSGDVELQPCAEDGFSSLVAFNEDQVIQAGGRSTFMVHPHDDHILLKNTNVVERNFYQFVAPQLDKSINNDWDGWRPKFYPSKTFASESTDTRRGYQIALEHLAATTSDAKSTAPGLFLHPNAIDIKLGQILHRSSDTDIKKRRKIKKASETTSAFFGARLSGAKIWENKDQLYSKLTRKFGFQVNPTSQQELQRAFDSLFPISSDVTEPDTGLTYRPGGLPREFAIRIIDEAVIPQLIMLTECVSQFKWRPINASLLVVFEGDVRRIQHILHLSKPQFEKLAHVKMIDFASFETSEEPDKGLAIGLETILHLFSNLSKKLKEQSPRTPDRGLKIILQLFSNLFKKLKEQFTTTPDSAN